ncbi:2-iminobutanoate/2-iminopropanoate deaminase-like isoform X2 [Paramormyrops kingsleyae]|uniref:2-iminobutanoate/2-iminopropanoate deaminase-like isoform X2 n=1 Tax=Paramormyrops kingsleyae TaxID=1676925 RepID=UPI003B9750E1
MHSAVEQRGNHEEEEEDSTMNWVGFYEQPAALTNMGEILKAAGCRYNNVVKTTVLLADITDFNLVNDVYKQFFTSNFPARAAYQVAGLPRGGLVEVEAVAVLGPITDVP